MGNAVARKFCAAAMVGWFAGALPAQDPTSVVREGPHFAIEFHPDTMPVPLATRLADEALVTVESAWPTFEKQLQLKPGPRTTVQIHVAPDPYRAAESRLQASKTTITGVVAPDGSEGHVLLYPPQSQAILDQVGLPYSTRQCVVSIAGKMLAQKQLGEKADDWAAEVIAVGMLEAWANPERLPAMDTGFDNRRFRVVGRHLRGEGTQLAPLVSELRPVVSGEAWVERFAERALLAEQMARVDPLWVRRFVSRWRMRKGDVVQIADRMDAVEAVLGGDWKRNEARFAQTVKAMRPMWQVACPEVWRDRSAWLLLGNPKMNACLYAVALPPAGPYAIHGTFEAPPFLERGAFRVLLDATAQGMLGVWFEAPNVYVKTWRPNGDVWTELKAGSARFQAGEAVDFRIEVTKLSVRVEVNSHEALVWPVGTRSMHAEWGIAVGETLTRVTGLAIEPLREPKK